MSERFQAAGAIREPAGLVACFEQQRADLLRFLRARTRDPAEADDVIQELWLRLQSHRGGPIGNARAYLFQMANNLVLDRARERRRRGTREQSWSEQSWSLAPGPDGHLQAVDASRRPDEVLADVQEQRLLLAAIAALPEGARRAFCLHKIDGLGHAEVAAQLGISRSGVEKHVAVAMKHLRRALADCGAGRAATSLSADSDR